MLLRHIMDLCVKSTHRVLFVGLFLPKTPPARDVDSSPQNLQMRESLLEGLNTTQFVPRFYIDPHRLIPTVTDINLHTCIRA